jgi:hypothetical protein
LRAILHFWYFPSGAIWKTSPFPLFAVPIHVLPRIATALFYGLYFGAVIMIPAYPIHRRIARKTKTELTPEILRLSEGIIKSAKN